MCKTPTGANLFKGDSLEILLDTDVSADFYVTTLSPDDFQLGISDGRPNVSGTKEAYLWLPTNIAGSRSSVKIASSRSDADGITRIEVAIPWTIFGITPASGDHFGFVLSASDNDNSADNVQQSMVSNVKTRVLTNPTTWGDLTLKVNKRGGEEEPGLTPRASKSPNLLVLPPSQQGRGSRSVPFRGWLSTNSTHVN